MFWEVNSHSKSIDTLLSKEDITLTELLDDEDILQDYKDQNKNLTQFMHRPEIIDELVSLITTEPPTDVPENVRFKYSNTACEILTSEVPVLIERLVCSRSTLDKFLDFLEQEPPLNPLLMSFCSKTFGMLLTKKSDQDWFSYQCVCLQMLEFIKSRPHFLNTIYKHMNSPVIVDLLYQIITSIEGDELRNSLFQWLSEQQLVCNLIGMLGNDNDSDKHQNIANLLCELIATGRSARQNELQKRGYYSSAGYIDGTNESNDPLIHILEDESTTDLLLDLVLSNKTESAIVSGITVIVKLLENPIINDPLSDTASQFLADAEKEHHKKIVANIVQQVLPRVKELHEVLVNPPFKNDVKNTAQLLSPPFGATRLHICTLLSVLIESGNPDIINAICETEFFNVMLDLFKQYCWNNILHSQVKKCFTYAFSSFEHREDNPSALITHILVKCKIASKLIDCWKYNEESQSMPKGRRLGYMGHLIYMLDSLNLLAMLSPQFRALVESSLTEDELTYWKELTEPANGYLASALKIQKAYLGGIDPNQTDTYDTSVSKDFQDESFTGDYYNDIDTNMYGADDNATRLFEAACTLKSTANEDDINDDNIFGPIPFTRCDNFGDNDSDAMMTRGDHTNWADFDAFFNNLQMNDNSQFNALDVNFGNRTSDIVPAQSNLNSLHAFDWDDFDTNNTVSSFSATTNDIQAGLQNTNDIKRWASVVSDIDDIQATTENTANTTNADTNEPIDHRTAPLENADAPMNEELNNANTITYPTQFHEQIDNAESQTTVTHIVLDDNKNDSETANANKEATTDATDLNVNETNNVTLMDVIESTDEKSVDELNNGTLEKALNDANEANDNKIDTSNESTDNSAELNNSNSSSDLSSSSPEQSPDIITTENE